MVTPYARGYSAENDLFNRLKDLGYEGKRAFKSQGCYDLLMFTEGLRPLLIEVKYYKNVDDKVIAKLKQKVNSKKLLAMAKSVDAYPLFAFKIKGKGYWFVRLDTGHQLVTPFKKMGKDLKEFLEYRFPFTG